ncbi:lecithin retinol acyltransferase family protein [Plesiomonas shigelloides]|uniref:lecithin retinol acyltransferase family protein n=1 Tax=Plesiomonas shigelloides TaxID=703 RepID=UPI00351CBC7D
MPSEDLEWLRHISEHELNRNVIDVNNETNISSLSSITNTSLMSHHTIKIPHIPYYKQKANLPIISDLFIDFAKLTPGCPVAVRLAGAVEHTGIYIGNDRVVELNGDGSINIITTEQFVQGGYRPSDGIFSSLIRTGNCLYVPYYNETIHYEKSVQRAMELVNEYKNGISYNILNNNCHMLTGYCIDGINFQDNTDCRFFSGLTKKIIDNTLGQEKSFIDSDSLIVGTVSSLFSKANQYLTGLYFNLPRILLVLIAKRS